MLNDMTFYSAALIFFFLALSLAYRVSKRENKSMLKLLIGLEHNYQLTKSEKLWLVATFFVPFLITYFGFSTND